MNYNIEQSKKYKGFLFRRIARVYKLIKFFLIFLFFLLILCFGSYRIKIKRLQQRRQHHESKPSTQIFKSTSDVEQA
jgi:hypothetical protein